jgi:hypothetical protein
VRRPLKRSWIWPIQARLLWGSDPDIVKTDKEEDPKGNSLDSIEKTDRKWMAHAWVPEYMRALMDSECGKPLSKVQKDSP